MLLAQAAGQGRLRLTGPQPAVVTFPQHSEIVLRIEVGSVAEMRRLAPPRLPQVPGLQLRLSEPSSSQQSVFDGRRILESFSVARTIEIVPERVGEFTIPAFDVSVGNGTERTEPLTLRVVKDIEGDQFGYVTMRVEPRRVYVHEPIRVEFEIGVDQNLQLAEYQERNGERSLGVDVAAPWLADLDGTVPMEAPAPDRRRAINLVHSDGRVRRLLPVEFLDGAERDGRRYHGFRFTRSFLASRPGKLTIPATAVGFNAYTGETRVVQDLLFARREPVLKTFYVYAPAVEAEVLALPEAGRPSPFYGAVGRFTVDARLDKERVKVGSSVKLVVSIRGEGNTEFLEVPSFPTEGRGFHLLGSKEKRERGLVEVTYDLTPLSPDEREVPPVAWNYFDTTPGVERYVAVTTAPLPIAVEPLPPGEGLEALPEHASKAVVPGVDDIFDMKPLAEGAAMPAAAAPPRWLVGIVLLAPWLLAFALRFGVRALARRRADVAGQRERGARGSFRRALAAGRAPSDALVGYLADRLGVAEAAIIGPDLGERLRDRGAEPELADRLVAAVEAGVGARYGGGGGVPREVAEELVEACERVRLRQAAAVGAALLLGACLGLAAPAAAQDAARGEAAYRAGDYAAAARAFEAAAVAEADRRLFYNLGNALYRQGEYARALAAWEKARLGLPRDPQLAANLALVRSKLDLGSGEGEPFLAALAALRDSFTVRERIGLAVALHLLAAALLVLGWRRSLLRAGGLLLAVPAALLAVELLVLLPARSPRGIVIAARGEVTAEPRAGLEAVVKLRRGASVEVLAEGPSWTKVRAGAREGYLPADAVEVVR
jgi:tetratricopeptide (TPR) repeat protein